MSNTKIEYFELSFKKMSDLDEFKIGEITHLAEEGVFFYMKNVY